MNHNKNSEILKRERKVLDREKKEGIRGGTKHLKHSGKTPPIDISTWVNRIICGDSESILKELPDNCIDIIVTSPP